MLIIQSPQQTESMGYSTIAVHNRSFYMHMYIVGRLHSLEEFFLLTLAKMVGLVAHVCHTHSCQYAQHTPHMDVLMQCAMYVCRSGI